MCCQCGKARVDGCVAVDCKCQRWEHEPGEAKATKDDRKTWASEFSRRRSWDFFCHAKIESKGAQKVFAFCFSERRARDARISCSNHSFPFQASPARHQYVFHCAPLDLCFSQHCARSHQTCILTWSCGCSSFQIHSLAFSRARFEFPSATALGPSPLPIRFRTARHPCPFSSSSRSFAQTPTPTLPYLVNGRIPQVHLEPQPPLNQPA